MRTACNGFLHRLPAKGCQNVRRWILTLALICGCMLILKLMIASYSLPNDLPLISRLLQPKVTELPAQLLHEGIESKRHASGQYMLHTYIWSSTTSKRSKYLHVCLATHTTVEGLHWIVHQAEFFQGPISVSVFTPGKDIDIAAKMITYLQQCHPPVKKLVNFHILYPISNQADYTNNTLNVVSSDISCSIDAEEFNKQLLVSRRSDDIKSCEVYPQNIARNLGWTGCKSSHVLNVDIDMIPNYGLAQMFDTFLSNYELSDNVAYILPVYEIMNHTDFPVNEKNALLYLIDKHLAQRFHIKVYDLNQKNSFLSKWEESSSSTNLNVMYSIPKYKEYWEPIMMIRSTAPKFPEEFIGYGFTRSSHVYLLNSEHYSFKVLNLAFLSHRGFQTASHYPQFRRKQNANNERVYSQFKAKLEQKLKIRKRHKRHSYILLSDLSRLM